MGKLGIVSSEDFQAQLANVRLDVSRETPTPVTPELIPDGVVIETKRGRGVGNVEVPESLRKLIAEEHAIKGRQAALDLASDFGISSSSVSAYAKGATSTATYHKPEDTLTNYIASRKARITKKALRVLTSSLDQITPEKLSGLKIREIAGVAKDMSTISKNMSPESGEASGAGRATFIVYSPQVRDERSYDTIIVNDNF